MSPNNHCTDTRCRLVNQALDSGAVQLGVRRTNNTHSINKEIKMTPAQKFAQTNFNRQYRNHGLLCKYIMDESVQNAAKRIGISDRTATNILRKFGYPVGYKSRSGYLPKNMKIAEPREVTANDKKCKVSRCYASACKDGFCATHYESYNNPSNWRGSLRMGKRLTANQKRHAEAVGTFIEPVRIFGKI